MSPSGRRLRVRTRPVGDGRKLNSLRPYRSCSIGAPYPPELPVAYLLLPFTSIPDQLCLTQAFLIPSRAASRTVGSSRLSEARFPCPSRRTGTGPTHQCFIIHLLASGVDNYRRLHNVREGSVLPRSASLQMGGMRRPEPSRGRPIQAATGLGLASLARFPLG
jgi:hypothetical protein